MGSLSVDGGLDTTRIRPTGDTAQRDARARQILSEIACDTFNVPTDADPTQPTPEMVAARRWRDYMYDVLGLAPDSTAPATPDVSPPAEPPTPTTHRRVDMSWQDRGLCRDVDAELFHPIGDGPASQAQAEEAKAWCRRCPVKQQCKTWALGRRIQHGVLGGMTEGERRDYWDAEKKQAPAA